ncbi:hypothetical protein J4446_03225 [Candidatus Woesearchaeota archaeon]|nr:hypothetical protein [Candidatus Woesearchaeota archaeon]
MNERQLMKFMRLKKSKDFRDLMGSHGIMRRKKSNTLLVLILLALILYMIFKGGNIFLIIGLTILLILILR